MNAIATRPKPSTRKSPSDERGSRWVIVLAGGTGERMRPTIQRWMGENRPKQFCTFVGRRTMLQHTIDRAAAVAAPDRVVTVIGRDQREYFDQAVEKNYMGAVLMQPLNRGTAAAVFHALAYIQDRDPDAIVVIFPSDHFVRPENLFVKLVERACATATQQNRITLLGARADGPETDYGWIAPSYKNPKMDDEEMHPAPRRVDGFHEKPPLDRAEELYRQGALWNTMVFVSKARVLHALGQRFLPDMSNAFETFQQVLRAVGRGCVGADHQMIALTHVYNHFGATDFSKEVLQRAARWSVVLPMAGVEWSDWGRPERIAQSLATLGLCPAFSRKPENTREEIASWRPSKGDGPLNDLEFCQIGAQA